MDTIETDRLVLRAWHGADFAPFAALNADPRVMEYYPNPLSTQDSDAFAHRIRESLKADGFGLYAVEVKSAAKFMGYVGLAHADFVAPFTPAIEIGRRLGFEAWGNGYTTEAALACLDHRFSHLGFDEVVEHPKVPEHHPLLPHVLYRIKTPGFGDA